MSRKPYHRRTASTRSRSAARHGVERLESRLALSAVPLGAQPLDTGEFMLGDVAVSVVFFESDGSQSPNTENWNEGHRNAVKQRIEEGLAWWQDTLALQNSVHELNFVIDYQYADNPVPTTVEPIARAANEAEIAIWLGDFLDHVGADRTSRIDNDIRLFNHQQRVAHETNWAFTIFVLNAEQDHDGMFAPGGVRGAFSIAGGAFMALPSVRPASTIAHEVAHQFWAMDEYAGAGNYQDTRGYYNTQNTNATTGNPDPDSVVTSLLGHSNSLIAAYAANISSPSSLESVGWKDSDGDGLFDVFDVPLQFSATAGIDPTTGYFRIVGSGAVGVLPNQNSWGLQNSITINQLSHVEYRVDGGAWQTGPILSGYSDTFDFSLQLTDSQEHLVEVRLIDETGLLESDSLVASTSQIASSPLHGFHGYVAYDEDHSGQYTPGEMGLAGWTIRVADLSGSTVHSQVSIEPDHFDHNHIFYEPAGGIKFSAQGSGINASFPQVAVLDSALTSTGGRAFFNRTGNSWNNLWSDQRRLRIDFNEPVSRVAIDAIADTDGDVAQLELFDAAGNLLGRYTTAPLAAGAVETMVVELDSPHAAYAVARGHLNSAPIYQGRTLHEVGLDNLQVGRPGTAVTNHLGGFSLPFDLPGEYQLIATPPNSAGGGYQPLPPVEVSLNVHGGTTTAEFAAALDSQSWHYPLLRGDINGDNSLDQADVDLVLTELRNPIHTSNATRGARPLTNPRPDAAPHLDVNGDGRFSAQDLLAVLDDLQLQNIAASQFAPEPNLFIYPAESADPDISALSEASSVPVTSHIQPGSGFLLEEEPASIVPSRSIGIAREQAMAISEAQPPQTSQEMVGMNSDGELLGRIWHSTVSAAERQYGARRASSLTPTDRDALFASLSVDEDLLADLP